MGFRSWVLDKLTVKQQVHPAPAVVPLGDIPLLQSADSARYDQWAAAIGITAGRVPRYDDFDSMDTGDIAALLDALVDAALTFDENDSDGTEIGRPVGFKIQAKKRNHRKAIEEILVTSGLKRNLYCYLRYVVKYGDLFVEPLIDKGNLIVGTQSYNPRRMYVHTDAQNRLVTGTRDGFPLPYQQQNDQGRLVAGWAPWELIHWKWFPSDQYAYSEKSLLDDFRADWKKLNSLELAMVVARVSRSYPRNIHVIDTTGMDQTTQDKHFRDYVNRTSMNRRRNRGQAPAPDEDLYLTTGYIRDEKGNLEKRLNDIKQQDPQGKGFSAIGDIEYLRRKLFSRVPGEVVGITNQSSREVTAQDVAFNRLVRYTQGRAEAFVRDVIDLGLLLKGHEVGSVPYDVVWPKTIATSWKWSDAAFRQAMSYKVSTEALKLSRRAALRRMYGMTDDEIDQTFKEAEAEFKQFGPVDPSGDNDEIVGGNKSTESLRVPLGDVIEGYEEDDDEAA